MDYKSAGKIPSENKSEIEFSITSQNEKESQTMLQLVRPKEGSILGPHYIYYGNQILYISDLHLDYIIAASKCKSIDDVRDVLLRIGRRLDDSYNEYVLDTISDGNAIVLIDGDITHSPEVFKMFMEMDFRFIRKAIIILGNHELWAYPELSIEEKIKKYSELSPAPVVQNEIILLEDKVYENNKVSQYFYYNTKRLSYEIVMGMSVDALSKEMSSARMIMLAGIGFSGCNNEFNAKNGIYRAMLTRDQEILESKKIEALYDHFIAATRVLKDRVLVVATHMPLENWKSNPVHEDGIIYISGHTHRNYFHDDGVERIYADNQNGYYGRNPSFKCVYTDDSYDPFIAYSDGIYEITKSDYILFYRAKKMNMQLNRDYFELYMLKKGGTYCFLARLAKGQLSILNGGRGSRLIGKNVEYYYEKMDKIIDRLSIPLNKYMETQKHVSEAVKAFGGTGRIHGCIVDIDFYNHIYVNPVDLTMTPYFALSTVMKWVYDSVPTMLEEHSPVLYENYQRMLESEYADALVPFMTIQVSSIQSRVEYLETDIYKASREISKMQKLSNNVLCFWNDDLLDPQDRYVKPPRIIRQRYELTTSTKKESPKREPPKTKENTENKTKREYLKRKYIGMTRKMKCGLSATVIEYKDYKNLTVQFENGIVKQGVRADKFMEGKVSTKGGKYKQ